MIFDLNYVAELLERIWPKRQPTSLFSNVTDPIPDLRNSNLRREPVTSVPTTFEDAVQFVAARISPETVSSPFYHFSGGMSVRNTLDLWNKEGALHQHMLNRFGLCHADDTGSIISKAADALVNGTEYNVDEDVEYYKRYWRAKGLDPATMEQIGPPSNEPTEIMTENGIIQIFESH